MGKGPGEKDAPFGQAIDVWRIEMFAAVTAQPIRSESIYRYEKDVQSFFIGSSRWLHIASWYEKENQYMYQKRYCKDF